MSATKTLSQIFEDAAGILIRQREFYCCHAIKTAGGLYNAQLLFSELFKPVGYRRDESWWRWSKKDNASQLLEARIFALLLAAEIARKEGR